MRLFDYWKVVIYQISLKEDIYDILEKVGLQSAGKKKIRVYPLGMKQKLATAQAIFEKPKILLLDEPSNGLDEKSVEDIRKILQESKDNGMILLVSHNKEDLEILSDHKIEISEGRIK